MAHCAIVPSSWLTVTGTWAARPLIRLAERVAEVGVDPSDTAAVLRVAVSEDETTAAKLAAANAELKELDARVKAVRAKKGKLEPILPRNRK